MRMYSNSCHVTLPSLILSLGLVSPFSTVMILYLSEHVMFHQTQQRFTVSVMWGKIWFRFGEAIIMSPNGPYRDSSWNCVKRRGLVIIVSALDLNIKLLKVGKEDKPKDCFYLLKISHFWGGLRLFFFFNYRREHAWTVCFAFIHVCMCVCVWLKCLMLLNSIR